MSTLPSHMFAYSEKVNELTKLLMRTARRPKLSAAWWYGFRMEVTFVLSTPAELVIIQGSLGSSSKIGGNA